MTQCECCCAKLDWLLDGVSYDMYIAVVLLAHCMNSELCFVADCMSWTLTVLCVLWCWQAGSKQCKLCSPSVWSALVSPASTALWSIAARLQAPSHDSLSLWLGSVVCAMLWQWHSLNSFVVKLCCWLDQSGPFVKKNVTIHIPLPVPFSYLFDQGNQVLERKKMFACILLARDHKVTQKFCIFYSKQNPLSHQLNSRCLSYQGGGGEGDQRDQYDRMHFR